MQSDLFHYETFFTPVDGMAGMRLHLCPNR